MGINYHRKHYIRYALVNTLKIWAQMGENSCRILHYSFFPLVIDYEITRKWMKFYEILLIYPQD